MTGKKSVHKQKVLDDVIISMAKTTDNKSQFVCGSHGDFKELDITTLKQVNSFNVKSAKCCVVTYDNKYLITAEDAEGCNIKKWSIRSKKLLHTWNSGISMYVDTQSCSYDNKYQLGGMRMWLTIFDLQKHQTLQEIQIMSDCILSVAFSRNNQSAFISDVSGNIKMIKWQGGANSEDDFDFTQEPVQVGGKFTFFICLTKNERYLLVGSTRLVTIFETTTNIVTKKIKLTNYGRAISLIKDGKKAIIAEINGNLSILDLETLKISSIAKNITNGKELHRMIEI